MWHTLCISPLSSGSRAPPVELFSQAEGFGLAHGPTRDPPLAGAALTSLRPYALPQALIRLSRIALLVAAGDLLTKAVATRLWSVQALNFTKWLSLSVVPNYAGAFGVSAGAYTWQLNLALTLAAIVFVIPVTKDLAQVDPDSPVALGLIVGGALGNLVSLLVPPAGVPDFIAIHFSATRGVVLNLADIAAYAGLAMILRTGFRVAGALVTQTRRTDERIGSAFAAKAEAKRRLRRVRIDRTPELVVNEWDNVADLGIVRADAKEIEGEAIAPVPPLSRRRPIEPAVEIEVSQPVHGLDD